MNREYVIVISTDNSSGASASLSILHALADLSAMIHANPDGAINAADVDDRCVSLRAPSYSLTVDRTG